MISWLGFYHSQLQAMLGSTRMPANGTDVPLPESPPVALVGAYSWRSITDFRNSTISTVTAERGIVCE
jgi:hypothetical protein